MKLSTKVMERFSNHLIWIAVGQAIVTSSEVALYVAVAAAVGAFLLLGDGE